VNLPHEYEVNNLSLASASEVSFVDLCFNSFFSCARYANNDLEHDFTAESLGTRRWPSQIGDEAPWPEHGPSQDFRNISSLRDTFSDVASEDMRRPLPEFEGEHDFEEGSRQPSPDVDLPQEPEQVGSEYDDSFDMEDAENLRRVIGDMRASTPPVLSVTMPWELRYQPSARR